MKKQVYLFKGKVKDLLNDLQQAIKKTEIREKVERKETFITLDELRNGLAYENNIYFKVDNQIIRIDSRSALEITYALFNLVEEDTSLLEYVDRVVQELEKNTKK